MITTYTVAWGEWDVKHDDNYVSMGDLTIGEWSSLPEADCADVVHSGTERVKKFTSEDEAMAFAKEKWENRDKWLAYLRVGKCIQEDIFDFFN